MHEVSRITGAERLVVPWNGRPGGRIINAKPGISPLRRLQIGRIVGRPGIGPVVFNTLERETALVCLNGRAFVLAAEEPYELAPFDVLYAPPQTPIRVDPDGAGCDLAEISAAAETADPVRLVPYAEACSRADGDFTILVDGDGEPGRLSAGLSHGALLPDLVQEQACCFLEAPPQFSVELESPDGDRLRFAVSRDDTVLVPEGFRLQSMPVDAEVSFLWAAA